MNTPFSVYDRSSGRILRTGSADSATAKAQAGLGEGVILEAANHDLHYVGNGLIVDKPEKPSEFCDFDYTRKQWVANPEAAWAAVKQQRARLLAGSDWLVTKAAESGQSVPPEWIAYRQALRDITLQSDPWAIVWPVAPI